MATEVYGQLTGPWWEKFERLNAHPRPSKREEAASRFLEAWGQSRGFKTFRDHARNLVVHVPATHGFETSPSVIVQSHVDMVVARSPEAPDDADPERGLIPAIRASLDDLGHPVADSNGDFLYAPYCTLGADNGVGCALAMVLAEDESIGRPPLELLFTTDEEEGMSGASGLEVDQLQLKGRLLINLDSEDDRELTIGCAGGMDSKLSWSGELEPLSAQKYSIWIVDVSGLLGGHSGVEIHKGRANAIRCCARIVWQSPIPGLRLVSLHGGDKRNAIPRHCRAVVAVPIDEASAFEHACRATIDTLAVQFAGRDRDLHDCVTVKEEHRPADMNGFREAGTRVLLNLLLALPHGVAAMTPEFPQLPETSNNLALVSTSSNRVVIHCSSRSSLEPGLDEMSLSIKAIAALSTSIVETSGRYRGWKPNRNSALLKMTTEMYREKLHDEPVIQSVHAGLECGVLAARFPWELNCISFGPNIRGNHAPGEMVEIASVAKTYQLLTGLVSRIARTGGPPDLKDESC